MKDVNFRYFVEQLSFLSLVLTFFLLWHSLGLLKSAYEFESELIIHFWESVSSSAFFTTFLGAVAGSGTILFMNHRQEQLRILSEICAARAIFSGHITNLINLKKQHLIECSTDIEHNRQSLIAHKKIY